MRVVLRLLLALVVVAAAAGGYAWHRATSFLGAPLRAGGGTHHLEIARGATFKAVVKQLADAGVVADPLVFELYGRYRDAGRNIKAGFYAIDLGMTPRDLLAALESGTLPAQVRLTIPEGYNRWQIADLLAEKGLLADREAFLARVEREDLEGRLFPDTYFLDQGTPTDEVVRRLTARFEQVFADVVAGHPREAELKRDAEARRRLLTLASLVEKEARTDRDRGLVSRVFHNRIERGMKLQTDPTCVYAANLYREVPHPRYCRDPSNRYSTYVIDGLPPTPIANPGRAALNAALRPAGEPGTERLLFFVARRDGSGEHVFSETLADHEAAIRRHLKSEAP